MSQERIHPEMHLFKLATTGVERSIELTNEAMKFPIQSESTVREHKQKYIIKVALESLKKEDDPNRPNYKIVDSRDDLMLWFMIPYAFFVNEETNEEHIAKFDALRVDFSGVIAGTEEKEFTHVCPFDENQPFTESTRGCMAFCKNGEVQPYADICRHCVNFGACTAAGKPTSTIFTYNKEAANGYNSDLAKSWD